MVQRKNGTWQEQVTITVSGKKKQKYFYGKTQAEVKKKMLAYQKEMEKGRLFVDVANSWEAVHFSEIQHYTAESYKAPLKDVTEQFSDVYINRITAMDIQRYINNFAKKGYARQTVKLRHIVLNQIFKHAIINGDILYNPAEKISIPKNLNKTKRELPSDEIIKQIEEICDKPFGLFAYFLLYTGCRRSEALALEWSDIDFKNNIIHIYKKVEFHGNKPKIVNKTKSQNSKRDIYLRSKLKKKLKPDKGPVFKGKYGFMTSSEVRKAWDNLNLGITQHQLRHAYVTSLYEAGIDPEIAMTQTGHADISTMRDIYTHIRDSQINKAAALLEQFDNN